MGAVGKLFTTGYSPTKGGWNKAPDAGATPDPLLDPEAAKLTAPFRTLLAQAPAAAPDLTDKLVQDAGKAQSLLDSTKRGRKSTFLTSGPQPAPAVGNKTLLGG